MLDSIKTLVVIPNCYLFHHRFFFQKCPAHMVAREQFLYPWSTTVYVKVTIFHCIGTSLQPHEPGSATYFVGHIAIRESPKYDTDELVNQFWHIDANVFHLGHPVVTKDDRRAMEVFQSIARNIGDRYGVGLPWVEEHPQLPDNRKIKTVCLRETVR
jgi:hypothetical protein